LKIILIIFVSFSFCFESNLHAQNSEINSLKTLLTTAKEDTNKVILLNKLSDNFWRIDNYDVALFYAEKAIELSTQLKYKKGQSIAYNNFGNIYTDQGDYPQSLKYHLASLKIDEELGDKKGIGMSHNNIGSVYWYQGNYTEALKHYNSSLKIKEDMDDRVGMSTCYNNIGNIYAELGNQNEALKNYNESLKIDQEMGDKSGEADLYNNIGSIYADLDDNQEALNYYYKAITIKEELGDIRSVILGCYNIGIINIRTGSSKEGKIWLEKSLELSKKIGSKEDIMDSYVGLSLADSAQGNFNSALKNYKLSIIYRDSILNEENIEKTVQMQMQYEFDKKQTADSIKTSGEKLIFEERDKAKDAQLAKESTVRYAMFGGLLFLFGFLFLLYGRYRTTQKKNRIIESQKLEVESQRDIANAEKEEANKQRKIAKDERLEAIRQKQIAEEKNKEILDSIQYAKRLQDAILPPVKLVKEYFDDSFILYHPKDIVSGDFYWMETTNELTMFAAADCTGHGVPGAMVSIVCANALNKVVNELEITDPGKILDYTREIVIEAFSANEASSNDYSIKDGMDISLCVLNDVTGELRWAGANNPLWIIRKDAQLIEEIKPDKQPIAKSGNKKPFKTHSIKLNGGDSIYMFSDGYADQFGGEKGKKFKASQFKTLLLTIKDEPMPKQKDLLMATFENWKGKLEQIDDVCIIGVKVTSRESNPFSKRELEILQLLKDGFISKLIADKLFISIHTVDTHRRRMLKKANVSNTTELINYCEQNNFI
jgi:tetratricopeptide (TPR) repeat protein/DNA-binding CsgD family transcriptional regulator